MQVFGFLNVDKPTGLTSRDVVSRIQRVVRPLKVGHAGTLDPLASGVLVVAVGQATRLVEYVQRMPKHYVGTFLLGRSSDTEDTEGTVVELGDGIIPSTEDIQAILPGFVGEIQQRPPAFSALKVKGRRAYDLARRGEQVELTPRPVSIHELRLEHYEYPQMVLGVTCGSGTYIRSLGRDIGQALGSAAVMSALQRTAIGSFQLGEASHLDELGEVGTIRQRLLPAVTAVSELPRVVLTPQQQREIANGRTIDAPSLEATEFAASDANGVLLAILARREPGRLGPVKNFSKL